jgi:hypothetical protein
MPHIAPQITKAGAIPDIKPTWKTSGSIPSVKGTTLYMFAALPSNTPLHKLKRIVEPKKACLMELMIDKELIRSGSTICGPDQYSSPVGGWLERFRVQSWLFADRGAYLEFEIQRS